MAKPASDPVWSTDGGTTLEPSAGEKAAGWSASDKPPARWFNWWMNLVYQWVQYLGALHNETEFLNKAYTWTGLHRFSNSSGILTESAGKSITMNAHYSDMLPNANWTPVIFPGTDSSAIACGTANASMFIELCKNVPSNAELVSVEVRFKPHTGQPVAADRMQFELYSRATGTSPSFTKTTALVNLSGADTLTDDGTNAMQRVTLTLNAAADVDRSTTGTSGGGFWSYYLRVESSATGANYDLVYDITQNFTVNAYNPY